MSAWLSLRRLRGIFPILSGAAALKLSKFVRAGIALSAVWVAGSVYVNRPDTGEMDLLESEVYERCMRGINTVEGSRRVEERLARMRNENASADVMRRYLMSEGFEEDDLRFSDATFSEPRREGYFEESPAYLSARLNRLNDCGVISNAQRNEAVADIWMKAALSAILGLVVLWVALLAGRTTMRWIFRGT